MTETLAKFFLAGKNDLLLNEVENYLKGEGFHVERKKKNGTDYQVLIYEIDRNVENLSIDILNDLSGLTDYQGKTCIIFACQSGLDQSVVDRASALIRPYLGNYETNLRQIICYDLYSRNSLPLSPFHKWLFDIIAKKEVSVSGTEGNHHNPTSVNDLCRLIIKSLFVTNTAGETFTAASEDLTDLEIAYLLKKGLDKKGITLDINLDAKVIQPGSLVNELSVQTQAALNWLPKENLGDNLDGIIQKAIENGEQASAPQLQIISQGPKLEKISQEIKPIAGLFGKLRNIKKGEERIQEIDLHRLEKRKLSQVLVSLIVLILVLVTLPFALTAGSLYLAVSRTYSSYQFAREGKLEEARLQLEKAVSSKNLADGTFRSVSVVSQPIARNETISTNNFLLTLGHAQDILANVLDTYAQADQLYQSIIGKQTADQGALLGALKINLISLSEKLSQIQLLVDDIRLPFGYEEKINREEVVAQISLLKSQITASLPLLDLVEKLLDNLSVQRYLLIVQDPNELRPGGGFLSSYGILTLDQGKIIDFQADSSLSFDRLIEGKIEPPKVLKQLTGQANWFFHDSNLDPDWSVNARQASWFYQRFRGHAVNGVIGLNLNIFKIALKEIGELSLEDGKAVNADNLNLLASNPTSSKGFDVTTGLTKALGQRLLSGEIPFVAMARTLIKSVTFDEIQFWFQNPTLEGLADDAKVAGRVAPDTCHPQLSPCNCSADTVYLNEANFSISKLNYYLKRQATYESQIGETGEIRHTFVFDYSYPVPAPTNFGGAYNAYYQFYYPTNGRELGINLDGKDLPENSLIKTNLGNGFTKVDFSTSQNINQPHRLTIGFASGHQLNMRTSNIPYTLSVLKQPGTMEDTQIIRVKYPSTLLPKILTLPLKQSGPNELVLQVSPISRENVGILFKNQSL